MTVEGGSIVCVGREWDPYGNPLGPPCGTRYKGGVIQARAAGWAIHEKIAMCPTCRAPNPKNTERLP